MTGGHQHAMIDVQEICSSVSRYDPTADLALIQRCYEFAADRHSGQRRRSGDPYVVHPVGVAQIISERVSGMLAGYDFISPQTLAYFNARLSQAPRDADFALDYVLKNAKTREEQEACVDAVRFKCNVLWVQLDALQHAYVEGHIPPGAFRPES